MSHASGSGSGSERARRVLVAPEAIEGDQALLRGDDYHYVRRVLRMKEGSTLLVSDGTGRRFSGRIARIGARVIEVALVEAGPAEQDPGPRLTLIYGTAKGARTDLVLQKATELGIAQIVPAICARSVARPDAGGSKKARWSEIIRQAARQCGRERLPHLAAPQPLSEALVAGASADIALIATLERAGRLAAHGPAFAGAPTEVALAVGPEGGFTTEEQAEARARGFHPVGLGPLTLRSETAAIALVAVIQHLCGRF